MARKRKKKRRIITSVIAVLLAVSVTAAIFLTKMRPVIVRYAQNVAKSILINASNEAVVKILQEYDISYDDIVKLSTDSSGHVTSLRLDVMRINLIKSKITLAVSEIAAQQEEYNTYIPLGTFLGNEYTTGLGPKIKFSMQMTSHTIVDFNYEFQEAGMNQVIHRVLLNIDISGRLVMAGAADSFSVSTTAIIAETVIVGLTPDAYTEVIENDGSNTAGLINDYGATAGN